MPGVPAVVERLFEDLGKQSFHQSLLGTLGRLGAGYGLALAAGIGFGLVAAVAVLLPRSAAQRHRHPAIDPLIAWCRCS